MGHAGTQRFVERACIPIQRRDAGRRVVFGEVMLPAPHLEPGMRVPAEALRGRVHFDGGYMTESEIVRLVDRFAAKRPEIDVQHDGVPRGANVVESFIAGEGWEPWVAGAWVVGVQVHEDKVWARIERGELRAFSIQFIVRVREVEVWVVDQDGVRSVLLHEFSDALPQFLSLVEDPATGATWKIKQRAVTVDREWDAGAAFERVRDLEPAQYALDWFAADVQEHDGGRDRLVVVRQALPPDRSGDMEIDRTVVPFQDLPLADEGRAWDGPGAAQRVREWAGGDDFDPERMRRGFVWYDAERPELSGSYKLGIADIIDGRLTAVPRGIFAAAARYEQADVPAGDLPRIRAHLGRYYAKMDRTPPWEEERSAPPPGEERRDAAADPPQDAADAPDEGAAAEPPPDPPDAPGEDQGLLVLVDGQLRPAAEHPDHEGPRYRLDGDAIVAVVAGELVGQGHGAGGGAADEAATDDAAPPAQPAAAGGDADGHEPESEDPASPAAGDEACVVDPPPEGAAAGAEGGGAPEGDPEEAGRTTTFGEAMAGTEVVDALFAGSSALWQAAQAIIADADDPTQAVAALQAAVNDFAQWAHGKVAELGAAAFAPPDSMLGNLAVGRAGRKMAKARLDKLKGALKTLADLVAELDEDAAERKESRQRSAGDAPGIGRVLEVLGDVAERLDKIERARPAPSVGDGDPAPAAPRGRPSQTEAAAIVKTALFGRRP